MLKIGDFSKLSRVSVRMLRHYDEIGLLKPTKTDKYTNYRYYSEAQLITVCRITALKNMGFSLFDVGNILESYGNKEKLNAFLTVRRNELKALSEETAKKLLLVETALKRLRKEDNMNYTVTLKTLPERYAACVDITIPKYEDEGIAWQILCEEIKDQKPMPDDPCYFIVVFKDGEYKEQNVSIEAQKTVKGKYKNTEHVKFKTLPPVTFASTTFKGGYENISEANAAVASWIEANGYTYSGTMFNIYHVSPKDTSNPDEYITEVCYPVVKQI